MSKNSGLTRFIKRVVSIASAVAACIACSAFPIQSSNAGEAFEDLSPADEMIVLINEARIEHGVLPLYAVPLLNDMSETRANECVGTFSHYRPDGSYFNSIMDSQGLLYGAAAENIAGGNSTAEATFEQLKNSPSHWSHIISPAYTHIGVGMHYEEISPYGWYWEELFVTIFDHPEDQYLPERYKTIPVSSGDVNGDSTIDIFDYVMLVKLLNEKAVVNNLQEESADCMKDGEITIADAIVLKKYILNKYDSLPIYP